MRATVPTWLTLTLALAPPTTQAPPTTLASPTTLALTAPLQAQESPQAPGHRADNRPTMPERHVRWLDEVSVLLSGEERQAFQEIEQTHRRDAFIEEFWRIRDPYPQSPHNEFREAWETRLALARQRYGTLSDIRAQVLLLVGDPAERHRTNCPDLLRPAEVWSIGADSDLPEGASVVFVKRPDHPSIYDGWRPQGDLAGLTAEDLKRKGTTEKLRAEIVRQCPRGVRLLESLDLAKGLGDLREATIPHPDPAWLADFDERSTAVAEDARPLPATLHVAFPGRQRGRTLVHAVIAVPLEGLGEVVPSEVYRFVADGEVLRGDELFESFRYRFDLPAETARDGELRLAIERHLRPGDYSLVLRLESLDTQRFFLASRDLIVPIAGEGEGLAAQVTEESGVEATFRASAATIGALRSDTHSITLSPPPPGLHTGRLRVEARTTGDGIAGVAFELDGKRLMTKRRTPWSIEVDLGRAPRIHELRAVALDASGDELVSDRIHVNAGAQSFTVRLVEPEVGAAYRGVVRARAVVDAPRGSRVDRVEFHVDETRLVTLYQPPWVQVLPLPEEIRLGYVRAVAYLDDGLSTESLVFVNSPENLDQIDINLVELYTTVIDRKGRPVEGLARHDFEVLENDVAQRIRRFEHASDLPFHAAVVLDTSTSMAEELRDTERAALQFFENLVTPRDRAAVVTFADEPSLVVPFTNDLALLAGGLADMKAKGETTLHDSIVFTLYHFGGLTGQRALILLSDGEDSMSRYSFDETLAFAREIGVAIYAIGLDLPGRAHEARSKLMRLCNETGGQHFFITRTSELERVYQRIENELRSQYLLAYQSSLDGEGYREIEVRLSRPGLEAKTIAGYDP